MNTLILPLLLLFLCVFAVQAQDDPSPSQILLLGENIQVLPNAPEPYLVRNADSLLEIVGNFVADPLVATQYWSSANLPSVRAGDEISLVLSKGQPALQIKRNRTVKLSPTPIFSQRAEEVPIIPIGAIQHFFNNPELITPEELEQSSEIMTNDERTLLTTQGYKIYVRGLDPFGNERDFMIVRPGRTFVNPDDSEDVLAYEAIYLGTAMLQKPDAKTLREIEDEENFVSTLTIVKAVREIQAGDRLLPQGARVFAEDFYPRAVPPSVIANGKVIAMANESVRASQYQVVVVNKGSDDGMERGYVLLAKSTGLSRLETVKPEIQGIPSRESGRLLVFKVFDRVSYALVMKSIIPIRLNDEVTHP